MNRGDEPKLTQAAPGLLYCPACGWTRETDVPPDRFHHQCRPPDEGPHTARRPPIREIPVDIVKAVKELSGETDQKTVRKLAMKWGRAVTRWVKHGRPVRTQEQIDEVVAICKACPSDDFNDEASRCNVCGCKVGSSGIAIFNKAKMLTETCPKGHWPEVTP